MIRVLLVDDSHVAVTALKRALTNHSGLQVVGTASHGKEALRLIEELNPQVVITDVNMPIMDGLALTREIMERRPLPVLVVSSVVESPKEAKAFEILEAGAMDVLPKPRDIMGFGAEHWVKQLVSKIKVLSGVRPTRRRPRIQTPPSPTPEACLVAPPPRKDLELVAIGASTGGPMAIKSILEGLPADYPLPIICVLHISQGFLPEMITWLSAHVRLKVLVAPAAETPQPGFIYFPPEDRHLTLDRSGRFFHDSGMPRELHRPSIDVTFHSLASVSKARALGVLLTGMGRDGAAGLLAMRQAGAETIAQDKESCVVWGMPAEAVKLDAAKHVLSLNEIAIRLKQLQLQAMDF